MPALRERPDDILPLSFAAIARINPDLRLDAGAEAARLAHPWPGNVRELLAVVERAAHLVEKPEIREADLDLPSPVAVRPVDGLVPSSGKTAGELLDEIVAGRVDFWSAVYGSYRRREMPRAAVKALVEMALSRSGGGVVELSRLLYAEARYRKLLDFLRNAALLPASERSDG